MLDKTIPYYDIIMKANKEIASNQPIKALPSGYKYKMYSIGDEQQWAQLELEVEEFDTLEDALAYFNRVFLPHQNILPSRMCFILDDKDNYVATSTAWFKDDSKRHYALLHWVSVSPTQQGKGLGSTIVKYALSKFNEIEKKEDQIFLHTQTWSYKAIGLYNKLGFKITKDALIDCISNMECLPYLKEKLDEKLFNNLVE